MSDKPMPHPIQQEPGIKVPKPASGEEPVDLIRQQNAAAREQAEREKELERVARHTPPPPMPLQSDVPPRDRDEWVG